MDNFLYDVFLSHSSKDKENVRKIAKILQDASFRIWFDEISIRPGDDIFEAIDQGIQNSKCLVLCMSKATFSSDWVTLEKNTALFRDPSNKKRRFIPLLIEDCIIPDTIKRIAYIDAKNQDQTAWDNLIKVLREDSNTISAMRKNEDDSMQSQLFNINGYSVAYIPILNKPQNKINCLTLSNIKLNRDLRPYRLPEAFVGKKLSTNFVNNKNLSECCRLSSYSIDTKGNLLINLSRTTYEEYLISSEYLDDPNPLETKKTYRQSYAGIFASHRQNMREFALTNICGLGVFVITIDQHIIYSTQPLEHHVYPGRKTFSSSGTLRWGVHPHPSYLSITKCFSEINHQVNANNLKLIGFGADARKLFYQFSFIEESDASSEEILSRSRIIDNACIDSLPYEMEPIINSILMGNWEPSAEAALITLCILKFRMNQTAEFLTRLKPKWARRNLLEEWDFRASCPGILPDTTVRYPEAIREKESDLFVKWVIKCLNDRYFGADVLEIGSGTGRITSHIVKKANKIICIDISSKMIDKNRAKIGEQYISKIEYITAFAQDIHNLHANICICSLVLIHNVEDELFNCLVEQICKSVKEIYLFEDISNRKTAPSTRIRSKEEILQAFRIYGFSVFDEDYHIYAGDKILFLGLKSN